jgi:hypothetical protein
MLSANLARRCFGSQQSLKERVAAFITSIRQNSKIEALDSKQYEEKLAIECLNALRMTGDKQKDKETQELCFVIC